MPTVHLIIQATVPDFPDSSEESVVKGFFDKAQADAEAQRLQESNGVAVALQERFRAAMYPNSRIPLRPEYEPLLPRIKFPRGLPKEKITQAMLDDQKRVLVENQRRVERNQVKQAEWGRELEERKRSIAEKLTDDPAARQRLISEFVVPLTFYVFPVEVT